MEPIVLFDGLNRLYVSVSDVETGAVDLVVQTSRGEETSVFLSRELSAELREWLNRAVVR